MKNKITIIGLIILTIIITISVIYNVVPRLQLNGNKKIVLTYNQEYEEPGIIVKNANKKYLNKVKIENNIDKNKIGNYEIIYKLKIGKKILIKKRIVEIIDNIQPVIKLKGKETIELPINTEYIEQGFEAYDEYDGNLNEKVKITTDLDTRKEGQYKITYEVEDSSNNKTKIDRVIKIKK